MTATTVHQDPVTQFMARRRMVNWEIALYVVIFLLAIFTRFYMLDARAMSHDESLHTRYSYNLFHDGDFQHTPLMHGPILFHVTAFMYFLFGDNDFTSRIYPAALGVAVVLMPLLFRRWLGRIGAIMASIMLLISPIMMYYNRYIRHDTPSIFFALLMIYAIMMYVNGPHGTKREAKWLYLLVGAMIGNLGSKETSFIYIAIMGSFLTLYWLVRLAQRRWQVPGKTVFYGLMAAILLGGVAALGFYVFWSIEPMEQAVEAAQVSGGWFNNLGSSSFLIWTASIVIAALVFLIGPLLWAFRRSRVAIRWLDVLVIIMVAVVVCGGLVEIEHLSHVTTQNADETAPPPVPGENELALVSGVNVVPLAGAWVGGGVIVLLLLGMWRLGWWGELTQMPEFEVLIVMGTLILPWLTPFILKAMGVSPTDQSQEGILRAVIAAVPLVAVAITAGLLWNWQRWLICVTIFYSIFLFFFTTMLRNMNGIGTGIISSLGYWLEQQGVRRGSQPQYYYLGLIVPFYEFLPLVGSILAMFSGLTLFWNYRRKRLEARYDEAAASAVAYANLAGEPSGEVMEEDLPTVSELMDDEPVIERPLGKVKDRTEWLKRLPFLVFVAWWAILNLVSYTLAGEKMPWLGTHLTVPLIFLTAWFLNRQIRQLDLSRFLKGGWLSLILLPVLLLALFSVISPFVFGQAPFTGLTQGQLAASGQWLGALAGSGLILVGIYQLAAHVGWRHLRRMFTLSIFAVLAVVTVRSAVMASFINYDLATEYLVYAHGAPAIKTVLNELTELSSEDDRRHGPELCL